VYREDELLADLSDAGATSFVDDGVLPDSDYAYEVQPVWAGGLASLPAGIDVTTSVAQLGSAIPSGLYDVDLHVTRQHGFSADQPDAHLLWSFGSSCEVRLTCETPWALLTFGSMRVALHPSGGGLEGQGFGWSPSCGGRFVASTLSLRLRTTDAEARRGAWLATQLRGTLTNAIPSGSGCVAAGVSYEVTAVSLTPEIDPEPSVSAAEAAEGSVYRVEGRGPSCGASGSGFVVAPHLLMTNAHVVAGMDVVHVERDDDSSLSARVVHFDPHHDVAVLEVGGRLAPPLPLVARSEHGETGAVVGYPGGGFLAWSQASIDRMTTFGLDIYDRTSGRHRVVIVTAMVYPGDSGGPVVSAEGEVLGMVARGGLSKVVAIPGLVLIEALRSASAGTGPVSTGPCR
jgi:S1-C subfamily serine protease